MKVWILTRKSITENLEDPDIDDETDYLLKSFDSIQCPAEIIYSEDLQVLIENNSTNLYYCGNSVTTLPMIVLNRLGTLYSKNDLYKVMYLESIGILCINSSIGMELSSNKLKSYLMFAKNNLPVPKTLLLTEPLNTQSIRAHFKFPVVLKNAVGSSGSSVYLCNNFDELTKNIQIERTSSRNRSAPGITFVVQEYIDFHFGSDLRVYVVGEQAVVAIHRASANGDFRSNLSRGGIGQSLPITEEIAKLAISATKCLGLEIAGVDLLFDHTGYRICEVNYNPEFKKSYQFTETRVAEYIAGYVNEIINTR
jgi:RimK family alpha-L-glutamate ligase